MASREHPMVPSYWLDDDQELETIVRPIPRLKPRRQKARVHRVMRLLRNRDTRRRGLHDCAARSVVAREFLREVIARLEETQ